MTILSGQGAASVIVLWTSMATRIIGQAAPVRAKQFADEAHHARALGAVSVILLVSGSLDHSVHLLRKDRVHHTLTVNPLPCLRFPRPREGLALLSGAGVCVRFMRLLRLLGPKDYPVLPGWLSLATASGPSFCFHSAVATRW